MRRLNRVLASLTLVGAIALGGVVLTRQVLAVAGEANAERLNRAVLGYIGEKNPLAPIKAFQRFPEVLFVEAELMCLFVVHSARHHSAADTILGPWVEASSGS